MWFQHSICVLRTHRHVWFHGHVFIATSMVRFRSRCPRASSEKSRGKPGHPALLPLIVSFAISYNTVQHTAQRMCDAVLDNCRARCTYEQLQYLLVVFCTGGPRTRNITSYFIWYGHCWAASATVSDVSSDPYQMLLAYPRTHYLIVPLPVPVERLLHKQHYHMHGAQIRVAVEAVHLMVCASNATLKTALGMRVFPVSQMQMLLPACA